LASKNERSEINGSVKSSALSLLLLRVIAVVLVMAGTMCYYWLGYKSSGYVIIASILGGIGWLMALIYIVRYYLLGSPDKYQDYYDIKLINATWFLIGLIYLCCLIYVAQIRQ
jgi:hypothetical protein